MAAGGRQHLLFNYLKNALSRHGRRLAALHFALQIALHFASRVALHIALRIALVCVRPAAKGAETLALWPSPLWEVAGRFRGLFGARDSLAKMVVLTQKLTQNNSDTEKQKT